MRWDESNCSFDENEFVIELFNTSKIKQASDKNNKIATINLGFFILFIAKSFPNFLPTSPIINYTK